MGIEGQAQGGWLLDVAWMDATTVVLVIMYMDKCIKELNCKPAGGFRVVSSNLSKKKKEQSGWVISAGNPPVQFEPENVARMANLQSHKNIHDKVKEAIEAMKEGGLPWSAE